MEALERRLYELRRHISNATVSGELALTWGVDSAHDEELFATVHTLGAIEVGITEALSHEKAITLSDAVEILLMQVNVPVRDVAAMELQDIAPEEREIVRRRFLAMKEVCEKFIRIIEVIVRDPTAPIDFNL